MKKLMVISLTALMMAVIPTMEAQNLSKAEKKEAQKAAKELVKDHWKIQGGGTIEGNMIRFMARQVQGETPLYGTALGGYQEPDLALSNCLTQAITEYVRTTGNAIIQERVTSELAKLSSSESANLVDMAELNFIKELKGELRSPVIKISRGDAKQGTFEMQCWWLINEDKIEQMSQRAVQKALSEVEDASEVGNRISDFVNGGNR